MYFYNQKPVRLIELFAGIGSQAKAMKNLGIDFQHWFVCEFDKYAIQSYNAVHGTNFTTSDVTKITAKDLDVTDTDRFTYLLTYSFPCQDLSNAGKGRGMEKGSGTRSGLLWEVERLLNECDELPQVLLMENVPQVHSVKNKEHFDKWIEFLESKGYSNHWTDLNAKDYGIPQSRNRCYMVSILGDYSFEFPDPIPLELRLGDMLEQEVDEKYYLSDVAIQGRQGSSFRQYNLEKSLINGKDVHPTILARFEGAPTLVDETPTSQAGVIVSKQGKQIDKFTDVAATIGARDYKGFGNQGMTGVVVGNSNSLTKEVCNMAIEQNLVTPYDIIDPSYANSRLSEIEKGRIKTVNGTDNQIANTLTTSAPNFGVCVPQEPQSSRIRKLTPKECWRLMGFEDEDFNKAGKVCSNSQLYKQAGNSIVVNVLMAIFKELFVPKKTRSQWLDELLGGL